MPSLIRRRAARMRRAGSHRSSIRVIVADSQAIDRGGLVGLLEAEPDFDVVGEAASVEESIVQCHSLSPDVLVVSLNLENGGGRPAVSAIREQLPHLRILAIAERGAEHCLVLNPPWRHRLPKALRETLCPGGVDCLQVAITQGALGTLRRSADPEELFRAVRAVAAGNAWYDAVTAQRMVYGSASDSSEERTATLTDRELDVAALIAEGRSNKEIAGDLQISEPTVKKHVGRILVKLGLQDRLQAGLMVARNPLLLRRRG